MTLHDETEWHGLTCKYSYIIGDWSGDPEVPGGVFTIPPYINDIEVLAPDGHYLNELLTGAALEAIITSIEETL